MTKQYEIKGMSCQVCVRNIKDSLSNIRAIQELKVQLESPQATISSDQLLSIKSLQEAIGKYQIRPLEIQSIGKPLIESDQSDQSSTQSYKPLILVISFILMTTLLAQFPFDNFSGSVWMRNFMAGFFIVFSFFKFLNLEGFANSYAMYDVVAGKWKAWGYLYPFIELSLGLLYLTNLFPFWTNLLTVVVLGISSIGVIQSNLQKRKIKCACLGDIFNLPMTTVTIIEDVGMTAMALYMLIV